MRRKKLYAVAAAVAVLALTACGGGQTAQPSAASSAAASGTEASSAALGTASGKDTLIVAKQSDPSGLDPHVVTDAAAIICIENMYDGLFEYSKTYGDVEKALVEDYTVEGDTHYIFKLRQGVKFHSGREMKAEDVVYSIQRIIDQGVRASHFEQIESMEAADDYTVDITLKEPFAPFLTYLAHPMNAIVDKDVVEANGGSLAKADGGSSAFKLENWTPGSQLDLVKFDEFWNAKDTTVPKVVFKTIEDATARSTALRNGEVDMIMDVTEQEVAVMKSSQDVVIESVPGTFWEYLGMNCESQFLSDPKVREAVSYAIDREMINKAVKMGNATILADANIPPTHAAYVGNNKFAARDVEKAKSLLAEAGYKDGDITVTIKAGSDWQYQVDAAQMIKQQLADIGIKAEVSAMESGLFFDDLNKGNFDMTVCGWSGFVDEDEYVYNLFKTGGAYNQQLYSNPEVDELLEEGRRTLDENARTEVYKKIQTILEDDCPMAFLYMNNYAVAMRNNVKGYTVHPTGTTRPIRDIYFE